MDRNLVKVTDTVNIVKTVTDRRVEKRTNVMDRNLAKVTDTVNIVKTVMDRKMTSLTDRRVEKRTDRTKSR